MVTHNYKYAYIYIYVYIICIYIYILSYSPSFVAPFEALTTRIKSFCKIMLVYMWHFESAPLHQVLY